MLWCRIKMQGPTFRRRRCGDSYRRCSWPSRDILCPVQKNFALRVVAGLPLYSFIYPLYYLLYILARLLEAANALE